MYFVNNRGNKNGAGFFSYNRNYNWLYSEGYSYLWCEWNCNVPESDIKLNINVPIATENGKTITGKIYSEIISFSNDIVYTMPIVWGNSLAYPPVDSKQLKAVLTMRQYRYQDPIVVPRENLQFAHLENTKLIPVV